ncbi:MAG: M13 family metallopeptidase [Eubacteriales bacterium]|nr:M13 family metallopeptidase [Eubacteriales bacterium]
MRNERYRKRISLLLVSVMLMGTGCSGSETVSKLRDIQKNMIGMNSPISDDSKWINSNIAGAIDSTLDVSCKDDYYTAINKDWLLDTELPYPESEHGDINEVTPMHDESADIVKERKPSIIQGEARTLAENAPTQMTQEEVDNLQGQIRYFTDLYSDQEKKDQMGMEPLRKYVDAIYSVSNLEEMNSFILNGDLNYSNNYLVKIRVDRIQQDDSQRYSVILDPMSVSLPVEYSMYEKIQASAQNELAYQERVERRMLKELGYSSSQVSRLVKLAHCYEIRLANVLSKVSYGSGTRDSYYDTLDTNNYTSEEISAMEGDFPLLQIMDQIGVGESELFTIYQPKALKGICATYKERHLEEIKAYYIMDLLRRTDTLVSSDIRDMFYEYVAEEYGEDQVVEGDEDLLTTVSCLFEEPLEELYAMYYCTTEDKEAVLQLTNMLVDACREMIAGEEWLSDVTKEKALHKLDNLVIHALYPETFADYSNLDIMSCENVIDAMSKINDYNIRLMSRKVNQVYDRNSWEMTGNLATTVCNAAYRPDRNAVYIQAGLYASGLIFDAERPLEENLGYAGCIIGHEIGHAFDSTGYEYDEIGNHNNWWEREDIDAYEVRVSKLVKAYNALNNYKTSQGLDGSALSGEAIGDMVGMKSVLIAASRQDSFDYEKLFESYAKLWRQKASFMYLSDLYAVDEHPACFLRANMTLSQFEKFAETYDLREGDGMYIKPEKRIAVW